jgi:hypothetical protein
MWNVRDLVLLKEAIHLPACLFILDMIVASSDAVYIRGYVVLISGSGN